MEEIRNSRKESSGVITMTYMTEEQYLLLEHHSVEEIEQALHIKKNLEESVSINEAILGRMKREGVDYLVMERSVNSLKKLLTDIPPRREARV